MAQAEYIITAICELVSRGQPPTFTSAWPAHTKLVAVPAGNVPHPIHSEADPEVLERRTDVHSGPAGMRAHKNWRVS